MKVKNIKVSVITIVLVIIGIVVAAYINKAIDKSAKTVLVSKNEALSNQNAQEQIAGDNVTFAVLGDIHGDTDKFKEAVSDLYTINPRMDALILNGDTVDDGTKEEYDKVTQFISDNINLLPQKIIKNIGNHEFYAHDMEINSKEKVQEFIRKYLDFSREQKVYHDAWVKDYHFISLGSEDGNSDILDSLMAYISDDQQKWLEEKLAEKYQKGKPIFVFLHQHLNAGDKQWLEEEQNKHITEILSKYPEVILFTSHTHNDLNANSVIVDKPFTMTETGAVYYTIVPDENNDGGVRIEPYIKGLYIVANGNNVIIRGRDMKENKWIFIREILK